MRTLLIASGAFAIGGALMKPSDGFTRVLPSVGVVLCFFAGAVFLTLAVQTGTLSGTYVAGLGLEALVSIGVGVLVLGERMTVVQLTGMVLMLAGLVLVHH
jgi:small multidrug resistance pump